MDHANLGCVDMSISQFDSSPHLNDEYFVKHPDFFCMAWYDKSWCACHMYKKYEETRNNNKS